jgi:hypothetical protein
MKRSVAHVVLGVVIGLAPAAAYAQGHACVYGGSEYSDGALSCQHGVQQQCLNGGWVDQGESCTENSGGAGGQLRMDSGAEGPAPTDAFMPGTRRWRPDAGRHALAAPRLRSAPPVRSVTALRLP